MWPQLVACCSRVLWLLRCCGVGVTAHERRWRQEWATAVAPEEEEQGRASKKARKKERKDNKRRRAEEAEGGEEAGDGGKPTGKGASTLRA